MNYFEPHNFYFNLPLYTKVEITEENKHSFFRLMSSREKIQGYSPSIGGDTTFSIPEMHGQKIFIRSGPPLEISDFVDPQLAVLKCLRTEEKFEFQFRVIKVEKKGDITIEDVVDDDIPETRHYRFFLIKTGQYPSIADLHIAQIKEYDKILSKEKRNEFTKAIGLAANGVGIGSFVYLRRIFEYLLEEAHADHKTRNGWDEIKYKKSSVSERIELVKDGLPQFLAENKVIYGILSKGLHELEEGECLLHFPTVKTGIELILDEKLEKYNRQRKIEAASKAIQATNAAIK